MARITMVLLIRSILRLSFTDFHRPRIFGKDFMFIRNEVQFVRNNLMDRCPKVPVAANCASASEPASEREQRRKRREGERSGGR